MLASSRPCRTANFCTKIPDSKPIPRKTKGMRTLVSTENPHAYFLSVSEKSKI